MRIALIVGVGSLVLAAAGAEAQPAYKCVDAEGRLMLIQGDPPPDVKCAEEPALRPAPPSQRAPVDWERKARETTEQRDREEAARRASRASEKWAKDVAECTPRARSIEPWTFTAHIPAPGKVKMLGSPKARYEFERCMDERGHATVGY